MLRARSWTGSGLPAVSVFEIMKSPQDWVSFLRHQSPFWCRFFVSRETKVSDVVRIHREQSFCDFGRGRFIGVIVALVFVWFLS